MGFKLEVTFDPFNKAFDLNLKSADISEEKVMKAEEPKAPRSIFERIAEKKLIIEERDKDKASVPQKEQGSIKPKKYTQDL